MKKPLIEPGCQVVSKNVTVSGVIPNVQCSKALHLSGRAKFLGQIAQKLSEPYNNPNIHIGEICISMGHQVLTESISKSDLTDFIVSEVRKLPNLKIENLRSSVDRWIGYGIMQSIRQEQATASQKSKPKKRVQIRPGKNLIFNQYELRSILKSISLIK